MATTTTTIGTNNVLAKRRSLSLIKAYVKRKRAAARERERVCGRASVRG